MDDTLRMRIECQRERHNTSLARTGLHALDDRDVPTVESIEVAERQHWLLPRRRALVVGKVDDMHGGVGTRAQGPAEPARPARTHSGKSNLNPSYASCMCAGRLVQVAA